MRSSLAVFVCSLLVHAAAAGAQGWIITRPCVIGRPCPPPPCVRCGAPPCTPWCTGPSAVVRTSSAARVELANGVLRYEVDETFVNRGPALGEADYVFPLPAGAAFQDLRLSIDGKLIAGETMSAAQARATYEEIVRRKRDPALVEWMGHGMLRARIFPFGAGEEKRVVVRFQVVAEREGDALRVDYRRGAASRPLPPWPRPMPLERPLDDGARDDVRDSAPDAREGARRATEHEGDGETSFVLSYALADGYGAPYSPTHALRTRDRDGQCTVETRGDGSAVTILVPVPRRSEPSISLLANAPSGEDGFALIALAPPAAPAAVTQRDVTVGLDVSGSMSGEKMEQARTAGKRLLATLSPGDRFRFIDFSTDVHTFRDDFVLATPANVRAAERYLDELEPGGSTNLAGALREALSTTSDLAGDESTGRRLRVALVVTDGEPTVGERDPEAIAREADRLRGAQRVFTFGVGADVNAALLERLALAGRGTAQFVRPEESVARAVALVASRLTNPIVTDLRVRVDGDVRLSKTMPAEPVDLFAGQNLTLFTRYEGSGRARLRFDGRSATGAVHWTQEVEFPEHERANAFVPRLWAAQRIGWLSAERRHDGASPEVDREIQELGERYGIPTEFSSYLVQEPGTMASLGDAGGAQVRRDGMSASASPAPAVAFERARQATAERAAKSVAALDSLAGVTVTASGRRSDDARALAPRHAGGHIFTLRDGAWTDVRYRAGMRALRVQPFSDGWFAIVAELPELREPFALGDRVIVAGRDLAVEVSPSGASAVSAAELEALRQGW